MFQTTADVGFNSFQSPINPMNANPGAWGIDPTYLTPSYTAPYRPQYQGPMGAPPPDYHVGFFNSVGNVFTPFGNTYNYGDRTLQEDPYYSAIGYRPADASMWAATRIAAPIAAFGLAMKMSEAQVKNNNPLWKSTLRTGYMMGGSSAKGAVRGARTVGAGWRIGDDLARGAASGLMRGMGISATGGAAGAVVGGAGMIGGLATSMAAPLAITAAGMNLVESTIIDPYEAAALTERNLRGNFANIYAGGPGQGNVVNGFGMSRSFAGDLSKRLTQSSIKDMTFDTYQMGELTDYASRSGMLDDSQLGQIEGKMKTIAKQVKMMMRVANEPDFKTAMEMLAELKVAGVSERVAGRVMANIGGSSAIAGISAQKMMNTVGAQGQYLYQANGLTPYIGQVNAAQSYGAFSSAFRMGLIDSSTMAKFGGLEGITQLSMTGQLNAAQTPYNQIMMMNKYLLGGSKGNIVGNLTKMGENVSRNPMAAAGAMELYGHDMMSRQLMEEGSAAWLPQLKQLAQDLPGATNKDGSVDVETAYLLLTKRMGVPEMEAKAMLKEMYAYHDPAVTGQMTGALQGNLKRDTMKAMEQEGLGMGFLSPITHAPRTGWKNIKSSYGGEAMDFRSGFGAAADWLEQKWNKGLYGDLAGGYREADNIEEFLGEGTGKASYELDPSIGSSIADYWLGAVTGIGPGKVIEAASGRSVKELLGLHTEDFDSLNKLAKAGGQDGKDAQEVIDPSTSKEDRLNALDRLNSRKKINRDGRMYSTSELKSLAGAVEGVSRSEIESPETATAGKLKKALTGALGTSSSGLMDSMSVLNASTKVVGGNASEADMKLLKSTYGLDFLTDIHEKAEQNVKAAAKAGVVHLGTAMTDYSKEDIEKGAAAGDSKIFGKYSKQVKSEIEKIKADKNLSAAEKADKIQSVTAGFLLKNTGTTSGELIASKTIGGTVGADTIVSMLNQQSEVARQTQEINSLASQGVINFDTQYSSVAALTLKESVSSFGTHVADFGKAVRKMLDEEDVEEYSTAPSSGFFGLFGDRTKEG